jgi:hypothetical protein
LIVRPDPDVLKAAIVEKGKVTQMSADDRVPSVLRTLAEVTERLAELAAWLRGTPGVVAVRRSCWMNSEELAEDGVVRVSQGDGYRIEWFVEADLDSGEGLSFGLDLAWHGAEWVIEASARFHTMSGEELVLGLPARYAIESDDLRSELTSQVEMMLRRRAEALP